MELDELFFEMREVLRLPVTRNFCRVERSFRGVGQKPRFIDLIYCRGNPEKIDSADKQRSTSVSYPDRMQ